jgi:hypothetical protein
MILVTAFAMPALAATAKPTPVANQKPVQTLQKPAEPCVVNVQDPAKITPEQMEILKSFEMLMGDHPMAPLELKSVTENEDKTVDTDIKLEAINGKIQLTVDALKTAKCERLSPPGKVIDYVSQFNDYVEKGIKNKTLKYAVKLCQDKDGLYIDPSQFGIRINVAPGSSESTVKLNLVLPTVTSCTDEVKREELPMN